MSRDIRINSDVRMRTAGAEMRRLALIVCSATLRNASIAPDRKMSEKLGMKKTTGAQNAVQKKI
jgi:hypothetical protein